MNRIFKRTIETAVIVALLTLLGTILNAVLPKLVDYWLAKRKEQRAKEQPAG
jgi:hypothetical protein